jgi:hypothetical protein
MRAMVSIAAGLALLGCQGTPGAPPAGTGPLPYQDAAPGLGFPRSEAEILRWVAGEDVDALRRHAWEVWAAITQPTPGGFPAFLTWYQVSETFGDAPVTGPRRFAPEFRIPSQKTLGDGDAVLSFNLYNRAFRDHVRAHGYQSKAVLRALAGRAADVVAFPAATVMLKTVWWPVRRDGLTAFPVWDGTPTRSAEWGRGIRARLARGDFRHLSAEAQADLARREEEGNDFETFARVVAIDPSRAAVPAGETAEVRFFDPADVTYRETVSRRGRVVPLAGFFHVPITDPAAVAWIRQLPLSDELTTRVWGRPFEAGDHVAFVAAHVSTREIPDWVWATVWWHDEPAQGRYGADRPLTVPGVFRHYRMAAVYHGDVPREPDGGPAIAFNPYLEAAFSDGPRSNCVACHQRAIVGPSGPGHVFPVIRGQLSKSDPVYTGAVRLDLVWSLAFETR